jgi:hypothetical protein
MCENTEFMMDEDIFVELEFEVLLELLFELVFELLLEFVLFEPFDMNSLFKRAVICARMALI